MMSRVRSRGWMANAVRIVACAAVVYACCGSGCLGPGDTHPNAPPAQADALFIHTGGKRPQKRRYLYIPNVGWTPLEDYDTGPGMGAGGKWIYVGHQVLSHRPKLGFFKAPDQGSTLLMSGGVGERGYAGDQAYVYNYTTDTFTYLTMSTARGGHTLTLLANGRGLIAGGYDADGKFLASAEIFDPATNTFTPTGSMSVGRQGHTASLLPSGRVLIVGGDRAPAGSVASDGSGPRCEFYDPVTGQFSPAPDSIVDRFNHSAVTLDDGRVLLLGTNGLKSAEVYDPTSNSFASVGDMAVVRGYGHTATLLVSGKVLVLGGSDENFKATAAAELFDPATNTFSSIGNMTSARRLHFATLMPDGTVIIGGGYNDTGDILKSAEMFHPDTNTFTALDDMPIAVEEPVAAYLQR